MSKSVTAKKYVKASRTAPRAEETSVPAPSAETGAADGLPLPESDVSGAPQVPLSPEYSQKVLRQAQMILRPLAAWLLRSGVNYLAFAASARLVFIEQARAEMQRTSVKCTDAGLSALSGLHRKCVRELSLELQKFGDEARALGRPSLASQALTLWLRLLSPDEPATATPDPAASDATLQADADPLTYPKKIPLRGKAPSFEALARQVSSDVPARTILNELIRLRLVQEHKVSGEKTQVSLVTEAYIPNESQDQDELLNLLAGAVSDHLWCGVNNITLPADKHLEQSIFANELTSASIEELSQLAEQLWHNDFHTLLKHASDLSERDKPKAGQHRMRVGMYFFSEDEAAERNTAGQKLNTKMKSR